MSTLSLKNGTVVRGRELTYTVKKVLGQGTFGITYLATTKMRGPLGEVSVPVALKEFFARDLNEREADVSVREHYTRRGDASRAATQNRYAMREMDRHDTQMRYAKTAWDNYNTQMRYAKKASDTAADYLRKAHDALRR